LRALSSSTARAIRSGVLPSASKAATASFPGSTSSIDA
jgi:hypothetical protein